MGVVIRRWVWLEFIGVISGCFPHKTYISLLLGVDKLCFFFNLLFYSPILNFLAYYSFLKSHYSFFMTYYSFYARKNHFKIINNYHEN